MRRSATELYGENTDGVGLVTDLTRNLGVKIDGARLLILGAGGATRGVLAPLLEQEPREVRIANRTPERARQLARRILRPRRDLGLGLRRGGRPSLGHRDQRDGREPRGRGARVAAARRSGATRVCYDMAYGRGDTAFMRWAAERGSKRAYKGWGMLVEQAAESYLLWHGVRPETRPVMGALDRL